MNGYMIDRMTDPDVQVLAGLSTALQAEYISEAEDPWLGSPFAWIRTRSSRQRGKIGEQLVAGWCAAKGLDVIRSRNTDADRIINGHRIEVKFSTLWQSGGYKFQQIRDQEYDYLICLGISPFDAHCWILSKAVLYQYVIGHMGQHTGAEGRDTAWLGFQASSPPSWLATAGGTLRSVHEIILSLGYGTHGSTP